MVNKRPDVLLTTLELSEAGLAKLAAYYRGLAESERAKYATPEIMGATFMIESQTLTWTGMRVMDQMETGPGETSLTTKWQWSDGRVRVNSRTLHRTGGSCQYQTKRLNAGSSPCALAPPPPGNDLRDAAPTGRFIFSAVYEFGGYY
jgi:hypothetical protein